MATYLWCRGQTWFFQLKPPRDLQPVLGSTPFRVSLPVQHHREASRFARYLAGQAEQWFGAMRYKLARLGRSSDREGFESYTEQDFAQRRTAVRRQFIDALLAEVQKLNGVAEQWEVFNQKKQSADQAGQNDHSAGSETQQQIFQQVTAGWNTFAKNLIEDYDHVFSDMQVRSTAAADIIQKLEDLTESHAEDSQGWKTEIAAITAKAKKTEAELRATHKKSTRLLGKVETALDGNKKIQEELLYKGPLLSECFEEFIATKINQLPRDSREPKYFRHRLNAFISLVADKRIADYDIQDLDKFADQLQYLPKRHTVDPDWRELNLEEAITKNKEILPKDREDSLSYGTARVGYIGKVKTAIRWLCARHKVRYPFDYNHVHIPKGMPPPEDRYPLSRSQLNMLFRACTQDAESKRPEDVWLPLLGYMTGARLGELVGLRTQDIKLIDGVWTGRLSSRIDGETSMNPRFTKAKSRKKGRKNRQIKNPDSLRRFALHHKFVDLGFIDWVDRQRDEGHVYLFPELHETKRPSGAASKRMQRLFESLGMGAEYVFHSLRHSFKDWARGGKIEERTIALQAGHSLEGVALNYGSKILTSAELQQIASLPIADGVGIDVFKEVVVKTSRNVFRRKSMVAPQREISEAECPSEDTKGLAKARNRSAARDADEASKSIRNLRVDLGMSQKQFADAYGFSCGAVRDWEQGRTKPGYSARARLYEIARDPERMISSRTG